jgi:membrane protein implicated in regulation of membrane protease activity
MDALIAWIWDFSFWHWLAFAVILAAAEIILPSTYFLWPAISAFLVGIAVAVLGNFDWRLQVLAFAVLAVVTTVIWVRWWRNRPESFNPTNLNLRGERYIGRRLRLTRELPDGQGRIQLDDTWWPVRTADGQPLPVGAQIEVVASEGSVLVIQPISLSAGILRR